MIYQLITLAFLFVTLPAWAQRGSRYSQHSPAPHTSLAGFSGFLDTEMPEKERFQTHLLSTSTDYGINDNLSVGTALVTPIAFLSGQVLAFVKMRYRFWGDTQFQSTLSPYFWYAKLPQDSRISIGLLSSNNQYFLNRDFSFMASMLFLYAGLNQGKPNTSAYTHADIFALLGAPGFRWFLHPQWAIDMNLVTPLFASVSLDTVTEAAHLFGFFWVNPSMRRTPLLRTQVNWAASDDWLFHLDLYMLPFAQNDPQKITPLPGVIWKW